MGYFNFSFIYLGLIRLFFRSFYLPFCPLRSMQPQFIFEIKYSVIKRSKKMIGETWSMYGFKNTVSMQNFCN